jgi:hypothetical protein
MLKIFWPLLVLTLSSCANPQSQVIEDNPDTKNKASQVPENAIGLNQSELKMEDEEVKNQPSHLNPKPDGGSNKIILPIKDDFETSSEVWALSTAVSRYQANVSIRE